MSNASPLNTLTSVFPDLHAILFIFDKELNQFHKPTLGNYFSRSMGFKLLLLFLFVATFSGFTYGVVEVNLISRQKLLEVERKLNLLNKRAVKSIRVWLPCYSVECCIFFFFCISHFTLVFRIFSSFWPQIHPRLCFFQYEVESGFCVKFQQGKKEESKCRLIWEAKL